MKEFFEFCETRDRNVSLYGNGMEAIEKTIVECLDRGILVELISEKKHELEAHMRQSDKLKYAQFMKMSVDEGRAEERTANREKTLRVLQEADLPEEYRNMLIEKLCN